MDTFKNVLKTIGFVLLVILVCFVGLFVVAIFFSGSDKLNDVLTFYLCISIVAMITAPIAFIKNGYHLKSGTTYLSKSKESKPVIAGAKISTSNKCNNNENIINVTVYYEHGRVVKLRPEPHQPYYKVRDLIDNATSIVSEGVHYDLTNKKSIYSIEIPKYKSLDNVSQQTQELGVTGYLDYILRMHAGSLWTSGNYDLALACLGKACQLMLYSSIGWQRKDYYRIVNWNIELGRFKKAKEWEDWIENFTPDPRNLFIDSFNRTVDLCSELKTDLVEVGDIGLCCEVCAKYRKRIYSLSGRSSMFPQFPKDFHFQCGLPIFAFIDGVNAPLFDCKNYVLYSNRPFEDDRAQEEIEKHQKHLESLEKQREKEKTSSLNRIIYYWFKPKFPDDFPKSLAGFSRMRNANSPKYQELIEKIEAAGYQIPNSLGQAAAWENDNN